MAKRQNDIEDHTGVRPPADGGEPGLGDQDATIGPSPTTGGMPGSDVAATPIDLPGGGGGETVVDEGAGMPGSDVAATPIDLPGGGGGETVVDEGTGMPGSDVAATRSTCLVAVAARPSSTRTPGCPAPTCAATPIDLPGGGGGETVVDEDTGMPGSDVAATPIDLPGGGGGETVVDEGTGMPGTPGSQEAEALAPDAPGEGEPLLDDVSGGTGGGGADIVPATPLMTFRQGLAVVGKARLALGQARGTQAAEGRAETTRARVATIRTAGRSRPTATSTTKREINRTGPIRKPQIQELDRPSMEPPADPRTPAASRYRRLSARSSTRSTTSNRPPRKMPTVS